MLVSQEFRQDLFYRINVFPIFLPALRERKEDIPLLVEHFLFRFNARLKRPAQSLQRAALEKLRQYPWPGNIRELRNVVERAAILSVNREIGPDCIFFGSELDQAGTADAGTASSESLPCRIAHYEKSLLLEALAKHTSLRQTALRLGISHTALLNKLKKYGIDLETL
jgi:transcriptional regulator of aroF, aroG, tyrA and aromatic amino acid transport